MAFIRGVAQSGLARLHGVQEVGGSNPLAPTRDRIAFQQSYFFINLDHQFCRRKKSLHIDLFYRQLYHRSQLIKNSRSPVFSSILSDCMMNFSL